MRSIIVPVIATTLLAGCVSNKLEKQNQQTLAAITASQKTMVNNLNDLNTLLNNQSNSIERLEHKVSDLTQETTALKTETHQLKLQTDGLRAQINTLKPDSATQQTTQISRNLTSSPPSKQLILGAIEKIQVANMEPFYSARIDTGSATSSLHANNIEHFEREGKKWVRFDLSDPDSLKDISSQPLTLEKHTIEAPIVRFANIRLLASESLEKRAVVELWVKIGNIHEKAQFTLANRDQMSQPILLGREFIRDIALVDVSKKFLLTKENINDANIATKLTVKE
ncbi:ATP-dependent zinc protease [Vibrio sp. TH_r3]|uniref:ATP-dependent zinc protease family protein n=1 Tax=Vibrio sp. TH_r3 TaxID=3082084 RepID=UPI002953AC0F|nr:ATP-dependent zinc protease [Vibrio sp. TH_r3]MDV7103888.1 ATP-dependent zinc protease [Vibrio sp. TH_r3]